MIYRIAIYRYENGQRKFDHYAAEYELETLRVNVNGTVQEAVGVKRISGKLDGLVWKDVSETHKVEWGCVHEDKALYENDIVTAEYYLFQDDGKYNYHGLLYYDEESYCMGLGYICVANDKRGISDGIGNSLCEFEDLILLGNINENPELLEVEDGDDGKFLPSPGTKEWAVYQMQRGEKVFHYKAKTLIYDKPSHYVRRFRLDKHLDDMSLEIWLNGADPTGWEIYQPKGD